VVDMANSKVRYPKTHSLMLRKKTALRDEAATWDNRFMAAQTEAERELVRRWVRTWQQVGPELEAIRRAEIASADNAEELKSLEGAFNHSLRTMPPRPSPGTARMTSNRKSFCVRHNPRYRLELHECRDFGDTATIAACAGRT
jgi:hypothetical protein